MNAPGRAATQQQPCTYGSCGQLDTRPYAEGPRCDPHSPWARAGQPDPASARYCPPAICYCGGCINRRPPVLTPNRPTVIDLRNRASGKSRAGVTLADYREAQAATTRPRQEQTA